MSDTNELRRASCCFTGHRDMSDAEICEAQRKIEELIPKLIERGISVFYAGGAIGFDLVASVTVLNMKNQYPQLELKIALPCRDHDKKWPMAQKLLFQKVMQRADSVEYVSEGYTGFCMQKRNRFMVDRSCICISWLKNERGGTYNTVNYAQRCAVEVINLFPPKAQP